jgi:uncharacterized protein (TIGR02118 family)
MGADQRSTEIVDDPTAVKAMVAYRRTPGTPVEEFQAALATPEADAAAAAVPGVRRYVRSVTTLSGYRKHEPFYDAVDELWFDDEEAARAALASPEWAALRDGLGADPASIATYLTHDHLLKEGRPIPEGSLKNYEFVTRKQGLTPEQFRRYWQDHHGPGACHISVMRHYVQSHTIDSEYAGGEPDWEGSAITWFDDFAAMRASAGEEAYQLTRADEENFLGAPLELPFIITTERLLVG